jgi:hypothetical protein
MSEDDRSSLLDGHVGPNDLEWCVDCGEELKAYSTLDLWIALSNGELDAGTPVWKLGRERWLPAKEVPELACAISVQSQTRDLQRGLERRQDPEPQTRTSSVTPTATTIVERPKRSRPHYATAFAFASSFAAVLAVCVGVWKPGPTSASQETLATALRGRATIEDVGLRQRLWEAEIIEASDGAPQRKKKRIAKEERKRPSGFLWALRSSGNRVDAPRSRN